MRTKTEPINILLKSQIDHINKKKFSEYFRVGTEERSA